MSTFLSLFDNIPEVVGSIFSGRVLTGTVVCKKLHGILPQCSPVHLQLTFTILQSADSWAVFLKSKTDYLIRFRLITSSIKVVDDNDQMKFLSFLPYIGRVLDVDIRRNQVGAEGMRLLIRAMPNLCGIRQLLVGDNRLQVQGMRLLGAAIMTPIQLNELSLEKNGIGGVDMEGVHILGDILLRMPSLETLNLSDNKLGVEGARILTTALPHLSRITNLDLSDNWLRAEGMGLLAPVLAAHNSLQTLNLGNNRLGAAGLPALTESGLLGRLLDLSLEFNQLGDGIRAFSSALIAASESGPVRLRSLNLTSNQLRASGMAHLSSCLPRLSELEDLNLTDNQMGPDGARALAPGLAALPRLRRLNAGDNRLGPAGVRDVAASVAGAAGLRWVGLEGNQVDSDGVRALAGAARAWRTVAAQGGGGGVRVELGGNGLAPGDLAPLAAAAPGVIHPVC
jgi:Ran GTPase-activating protein (RanGAP) involved in mRNA processing and transport